MMSPNPTAPTPVGAHPRGRSAGQRNANCRSLAAGGDGLANGGVEPPLHTWQPVYHRLNTGRIERNDYTRDRLRQLLSALLGKSLMTDDEFVLAGHLLELSDKRARAVKVSVKELAEITGWNLTKVKKARTGLIRLGFLVRDNRRTQTDVGVRQRSNVYGFTWTVELVEAIGWSEQFATKHLGRSDAIWNRSERVRRRRELAERARLSAKAEAERCRALAYVDEILDREPAAFQQAAREIEDRYAGDPEMVEFALDYLGHMWPRYEAGRYGRQLAGLSSTLSRASMELRILDRFDDPDLIDLAMAVLPAPDD